MKTRDWICGIALLCALFFPVSAFAQCEVTKSGYTLTWDASPSLDVTEYRIYESITAGGQDFQSPPHATIAAPTLTWDSSTNPVPEGDHYFVATAADDAGNESVASNELCVTVDDTAPGPPANLRMSAIVNGETVAVVEVTLPPNTSIADVEVTAEFVEPASLVPIQD